MFCSGSWSLLCKGVLVGSCGCNREDDEVDCMTFVFQGPKSQVVSVSLSLMGTGEVSLRLTEEFKACEGNPIPLNQAW